MRILSEKKDTKRPAIVAAATSLFARRGIDGTSMRDVAHAAGVREAAIYRHFTSKEQMAQEIFASWYGWYSRQISEIVDAGKPLRDKIAALVTVEFEAARAHPQEFLYFCENETRFVRRLRKDIPRARTKLIEMVRAGQRNREIRSGDPEMIADLLGGALCAVAISAIRRKDPRLLNHRELAAEACWQLLSRNP